MNILFDQIVARAHRIKVFGKRYHPYFLATDVAALASLALAWKVCEQLPGFKFSYFLSEFLGLLLIYRGVLFLKSRYLSISARSFLQDTVLFLLPIYAGMNFILGCSVAVAFDASAAVLPIYVAIIRLGCFLSGCCYGLPAGTGVLYPETVFREECGCRQYSPGLNPGTRVFPIQLCESVGLIGIYFSIHLWLSAPGSPHGLAMLLFIFEYSVLRFFLDFFRSSSARPRVGIFSEAQAFSIVTGCLCAGLLYWLR